MPISSSLNQIRELLGAEALDNSINHSFVGLEFDSREIKGGEMFIALPGEKKHGNEYVSLALERGAAIVIAEKGLQLVEHAEKSRILLVPYTLEAFWKIAAWWRDQINLPTFAVTGSVGKTTVKEMVASILLQQGVGTFSLKSHNNHVGVPYTICRASRDHKWLVLEIGMNHSGEIKPLSELAKPDVAAVVSIAPAHIGYLGSLSNIAKEKLQIYYGLKERGVLLLNSDSEALVEGSKLLQDLEDRTIYMFGSNIKGQGAINNLLAAGLNGISFDLSLDGDSHKIKMKVLGRQNAQNAACAALAVKFLFPDFPAEKVISGLSKFSAPLMRLNVKYLSNGAVVVDDSYNANPASMKAAILLAQDLPKPNQKVGLVIGDMLELGEFSEMYHKEIGKVIRDVSPKFCIAVGPEARFYLDSLNGSSVDHRHCVNSEEASLALEKMDFDFLIVKASRGIGLEKVVNDLVQRIGELPFEPELNDGE